jgi:hypothetical protein
MKTRRKREKVNINKTRKNNIKPSLTPLHIQNAHFVGAYELQRQQLPRTLNVRRFKTFQKNNSLYASKKYSGDELLNLTKKNELKKKQPCILDNLSWFGNYKVAKSYQTNETKLYEWKFKKQTNLLIMNKENDDYFRSLFLQNTKVHLLPSITLSKEKIEKIKNKHIYLSMNKNERAYYEFCFVFGYLTVEEQYEFMKLLKYLLEEKIIVMDTRNGESILSKLFIKINYYKFGHIFHNKQKYNRLSFYHLDKHAVLNVCKLLKSRNINISGLFQENTNSFWFPDFIVYKMNIEETILFYPHHNLTFYKLIE